MMKKPLDSKEADGTSVAIVCFINDPFDEPGGKRFGGGHLVLRELAEFLVCKGFNVTLITRLNDPNKRAYQEFGPRFRIHRVSVGPTEEIPPAEVGKMINQLEESTRPLLTNPSFEYKALHTQYWISGEVCRRINKNLRVRHIHHMLSFGRQKQRLGEKTNSSDRLRDQTEIAVANSADVIVAQCPSEARDLLMFYPELNHRRIAVIPHGIDTGVFHA